MRKPALILLPVLLGAVLLIPKAAEAQYYGGGGYGYAPQPRPQFGYRHRIHGYLGGQLSGIATVGQTLSPSNNVGGYLGHGGAGGGLFGGIRLGPFFALELNYNITWHQATDDSYWTGYWSAFTLQTLELNGKLHIPTRGPVEPYIQAGIGLAFLGVSWEDRWAAYGEDYLLATGVDFNVGAGLDFWLSPFVSLGGRILYKGMRFGSGDIKVDVTKHYDPNFASAVNVDLNLTLHF